MSFPVVLTTDLQGREHHHCGTFLTGREQVKWPHQCRRPGRHRTGFYLGSSDAKACADSCCAVPSPRRAGRRHEDHAVLYCPVGHHPHKETPLPMGADRRLRLPARAGGSCCLNCQGAKSSKFKNMKGRRLPSSLLPSISSFPLHLPPCDC